MFSEAFANKEREIKKNPENTKISNIIFLFSLSLPLTYTDRTEVGPATRRHSIQDDALNSTPCGNSSTVPNCTGR